MEVHTPHGPVKSIKEFMVHLLAITIGLLIALGLEASVEWRHYRNLVREAKDNIAQEIRDNDQTLTKVLSHFSVERDQLKAILAFVNDRQHNRPAKLDSNMQWTAARLSDSAWTTSASSGATSHMSYAEAKRYSQLYAEQELYNSVMQRYIDSRLEMYGLLIRLNLSDKPSDSEFEIGKRTISYGIETCQGLWEVAQLLRGTYNSFGTDQQAPASGASK